MSLKPIKDWKHVFIDTSVIIDYLQPKIKPGRDASQTKKVEASNDIFEYFYSQHKVSAQNKPQFYISTITLAELRKSVTSDPIYKELIRSFNCADVHFVDFTRHIANLIHVDIQTNAFTNQQEHLNKLLRELEKEVNAHGSATARNWVTCDLKIVASAKSIKNLDVLLTADEKTMLPLAERFAVPCCIPINITRDLFGQLLI